MTKLVLTRKAGESVKIGDSLTLTVREVHPAKVYVHAVNGLASWMKIGEVGNADTNQGHCLITICAINKGIVKLLFEADRRVTIVRTELLK